MTRTDCFVLWGLFLGAAALSSINLTYSLGAWAAAMLTGLCGFLFGYHVRRVSGP